MLFKRNIMKFIKFTGILVASLFYTVTHAQTLTVGVVNVQQLLEQVPQAQAATLSLQNEFAEPQRELIAIQSELQQLQETYDRDAPVMGQTERTALERQLLQAQRDFEREQAIFQEDLNIRRNEELNALQILIFQQIQAFAQNQNYDLIVADALYYSNAIDVTDDILIAMQELFAESTD
jgi:outer membrane protein